MPSIRLPSTDEGFRLWEEFEKEWFEDDRRAIDDAKLYQVAHT